MKKHVLWTSIGTLALLSSLGFAHADTPITERTRLTLVFPWPVRFGLNHAFYIQNGRLFRDSRETSREGALCGIWVQNSGSTWKEPLKSVWVQGSARHRSVVVRPKEIVLIFDLPQNLELQLRCATKPRFVAGIDFPVDFLGIPNFEELQATFSGLAYLGEPSATIQIN